MKRASAVGADVVFVLPTAEEAVLSALEAAGPAGRVVFYSPVEPSKTWRLSPHSSYLRDLSLRFSYSSGARDLREALALLERRAVRAKDLVTHRVPLVRAAEAFAPRAAGGRRPQGRRDVLKKRLDIVLVERALAESRTRAEALILAGRVSVAGHERVKPGTKVAEDAEIAVGEPEHPWVSRGGVKLDFGLTHFAIEPEGRICLDLGASTGGFTDVLLARGASRVYAVDVGYGQLHGRLRSDARVVVREKVNARFLSRADVPEARSLLVADVSFISLHARPAGGRAASRGRGRCRRPRQTAVRGRAKGGRPRRHRARRGRPRAGPGARDGDRRAARALRSRGAIPSPITGAEGNVELLAAFRRNPATLPG